jgi:hypothetical protein
MINVEIGYGRLICITKCCTVLALSVGIATHDNGRMIYLVKCMCITGMQTSGLQIY